MDKRQKEVQLELLNHEEKVTDQLKQNYQAALAEMKTRIRKMKEDPSFKEEDIYRIKYQRMLEAQLETILHKLGGQNVEDMSEYLDQVYREAYLGCLYGMHGDGVDLLLQVDENKVQKCINKDTKGFKFSKRLYKNVEQLKKTVKAEIARGFSTGRDYASIARQISLRAGISLARACVIARTEGHRVTSESEMDCMAAAKSKGADVVKEWISTLDSLTRETHVELDGQIRELEEEFEIPSSGAKAMYPGGFGIAGEDINCRCCMNQRARWNLDSREYRYSRAVGRVVNIKSEVYREWKKKYTELIDALVQSEQETAIGVEDRDPPNYIDKVNIKDSAAVNRVISTFEAENRNEKYEKALVILQDGSVFECYGTKQSVYPDIDLGDEIRGAVITHNHPAEYTEHSFSDQDCNLFEEFSLKRLRGVDAKYTYELTRLNGTVDELESIFDIEIEEGAQNEAVKDWAARKGFGYTRRKLDDQAAGRAGVS